MSKNARVLGGPPPGADYKCPDCGSDIEHGYGLAYGGMGPYWYCSDENCIWYHKELESLGE